MNQENPKKNSGAELALKVFAEHLIEAFYREQEHADERLGELRAKAEHGEATSLPNDDYETYRFWEGQQTAYDNAMSEIYSFMRRLGYEEY